jgi:2-keto-3-deoxy-L-fuconate dehydrogenase
MARRKLEGLRVLVTGASQGIGRALCVLAAKKGCRVLAAARSQALLGELAAEVKQAGGTIATVVADVTKPEDRRAMVAAAQEHFGGLDVLVNNAGIGAQGTVADNCIEEWRRVLDINLLGVVRVTRAALPYLKESDHAAVVNVGSIAATAGLPDRALYSASKGAITSLTFAMAADHLSDGIRFNIVSPGTADTPWVARLLSSAADPAAERAALMARQPHGRLVSASEIAEAIVYLASPTSGSTNGVSLPVDGGMQNLRLRPRRE